MISADCTRQAGQHIWRSFGAFLRKWPENGSLTGNDWSAAVSFIGSQPIWLPQQMECGNQQIRKSAVALWIPMTQNMNDTSFESPKCKLQFEISNTSKTVRLLNF